MLKHPDLYKAVLGDSEPCRPKLDMANVLIFDLSFTCRNAGASRHVAPLAIAPAHSPLQMDKVADFMFNGMKQLQSMNMQMMQGYMNGKQTGVLLSDPTQTNLSRITQGIPFSRPCHRNATMQLADLPTQESRAECNDQLKIIARTDASEPKQDIEQAIVPKQDSDSEQAIVHKQDSKPKQDEPNDERAKPSVSSVLIAIADRNRERAQERADEKLKKAKDKNAKEDAEKEEVTATQEQKDCFDKEAAALIRLRVAAATATT